MYHTTSKGIAALGRHGDDTLLHVSKEELAGLQKLLGPLTTNPKTGMPEAFAVTDILKSLGLGILGAWSGGAAAPLLGTIGSTIVGAGTSALAGGGISAAEGKGFAPGAVGGLISGGMGGFGAADMPGGAAPVQTPIAGPVQPGAATPVMESAPAFGDALKQQASAMMTKPGMEYLMKPIGMGALLGYGAESTMDQANTGATQMRAQKLQQAEADRQQKEYFASLGYDLPPSGTSWSPTAQRNYFDKIIYGAAAGGPIEMSRTVAGIPVQTTIPPKYVSQFENMDVADNFGPALQDVHKTSQQIAQSFANGGYANTQPFNPQQFHPQSQIPSAQPYGAAAPTSVIDTLHEGASFAGGGAAYEKGGFLDGPGDGMSDDIPANIDGREEIRLADGEFVVPPEMVSLIGGGDPEEGKRLLDQLLPMVRQASHGKKEQIKQDAGKLAAEKLLTRKQARGDARRSGIEAA